MTAVLVPAKYARHTLDCNEYSALPQVEPQPGVCSCGLSQALAAPDAEQAQVKALVEAAHEALPTFEWQDPGGLARDALRAALAPFRKPRP